MACWFSACAAPASRTIVHTGPCPARLSPATRVVLTDTCACDFVCCPAVNTQVPALKNLGSHQKALLVDALTQVCVRVCV